MVPVRGLIAAHPGLVQRLRRFTFPEAAQLAASLSLLPDLHAQTIRIEILQHLVASCAEGKRTPERDDLAEWAGKYLTDSPFARHEDPVEDVFVGSANSPFGSFRLLMGVVADGDFWIERLLVFLAEKQEFPPFEAALAQVIPLLKLSDQLVDRLGLERYRAGGGARAAKIPVPRWRDLQIPFNALVFSSADLAGMGVTRSDLDDFVFKEEHRGALVGENMWHSTLERHPLLECGDGLMVAAPSAIGRTAIRFMVEWMTRGLGGFAEMFFETESASLFVNEVARALDIHSIEFAEPTRPADLPPLYPYFGQFDVGKPAILLTYCPALKETVKDFAGHDTLTEAEQAALHAHLRACAAEFEKLPGFSGGMVLISAAGLRSNLFGISEWNPRWHVHACTLPDWLRLTAGSQCTAMRLWKLAEHEAVLRRNGAQILNLAGLPNLFAAWKRNGFRILPRDRDARGLTMLTLECDFVTDLRVEVRQRDDAHCRQSNDGKRWIKLVRYNAAPLFKDDERIRLYADRDVVTERRLTGCIEEGLCAWWVVFRGDDVPEQRSTVFQLWECVFSWAGRLAKVALEDSSPLRGVTNMEIELQLPNLSSWQSDESPRDVPRAAASASIDVGSRKVILTLPEGFLNEFGTPKNVAERKIVETLLKSTAALAQIELPEAQLEEMTRKTIPNDDARYFHVVRARSTEQLFAGSDKPRPLLVTEEDFAFSAVGVAQLAGRTESGNIVGLGPCRDFLKDVVTKIWERIEGRLGPFQRMSVVSSCLHELDEIARDETRWDMTTRSQLALRSNTENVHDVLGERRSERNKATLSNRLLIETAQYACGAGNQLFTRADHLSLLADMALLVMVAHHRDALAYGFIKPEVHIFPNGEIEVDESFYSGTYGKYMTKRSRERTESAAESYEDYFPPSIPTESPECPDEVTAAITKLDKVFTPEFGFSINLLFKLVEDLTDFALYSGQPRGSLEEVHLRAFLQQSGFSQSQSDSFLDRFSLPMRSAWNLDFPASCHQQDVYPWRFRRQLSLFMRPLPQVSAAPRAWIVSVPALTKSVSYILGHIERARLPEDFFRSKEMRRYIGDTINKRGHAFAKEVEQLVNRLGYLTEGEVEMAKLGSPKKEGLGDVDVLAWDVATGVVLVIECKRLMTAVTVREVLQRLEDFRGNREEKDSLGRHLRRVDWLTKHPEALSKYIAIPVASIRLIPLLVTSETVPMQFFAEMKLAVSNVVPYDELEQYIAANHPIGRRGNT